MEFLVTVDATIGSPFAPPDGSDGHDLMSAGSTRVTGYPVGSGSAGGTLTGQGGTVPVLLLMEEPALPDRTVRARPVALLHALVDGRPETRVLCVPAHDANFASLADVSALRVWHADEDTVATVLRRFDRSHRWRVMDFEGAAAAEEFLTEARRAYERLTGCPG
ncbi:inorganic diphosphatase [Streptomyces sp. NPDC005435]|uniref:inorganic diphosphatase n=1 Tax=Streptomyces sp. NPDC005435 TaxID=3154464 RepID=UPI0034557AF4